MEKIDKRSKEYRNQKKKAQVEGNAKFTGGKIQEIIDSKQAPGMKIASPQEKFVERYKQDNNGRDPNEPLDWSQRRQTGGKLRDIGI